MPSFAGKFQYLNPDGSLAQSGPCRVAFETESLTLVPASGAPLAFDLGDIDVLVAADYELTLTLYTGKRLLLNQFGKVFQNLAHDLLEAYRARLIQCLLLEDLEEVARFDGVAQLDSRASPVRSFSGPVELRLYRSNLAVLPTAATGFQWRLADIDAVQLDETNYAIILDSAGERLALTKLAKRTREFVEHLQDCIARLTEKSATVLRNLFPFLDPDQFQQAAQLLKEGHDAPLAKLMAIDPRTEQALVENVVDTELKPYFDALVSHVPTGWLYTGFKLIRREEEGEEPGTREQPEETATEEASALADHPPSETREGSGQEAVEEAVADKADEEESILHWFFFPLATWPGAKLPSNLVAWEATSKSGRATYFFRLVPPEQVAQLRDPAKAAAAVDAAIRQLNRAIVLLNFRREPIYLPDEALEIEPRYRRYAIACRKLRELRRLRASFLGRAIHTSLQAWQKQLEGFLAKA